MIHIKGSLHETALLDVRAIDTKLAKWQRRSDSCALVMDDTEKAELPNAWNRLPR